MDLAGCEFLPIGAVKDSHGFACDHIPTPSDTRCVELPEPIDEGGNGAVLSYPITARAIGDHIALPLSRAGGWRGLRVILKAELYEHIERAHRLVMGDVFLRLRGLDERQGKAGTGLGHWGLSVRV